MRKPEDICLLCKNENSTKTNSHWIPMAMIKSMVGSRNYEESYQFSNYQKEKLNIYFGRSNLKNTNPEIVQNHYALDYIFCPTCEEKLGRIEGAVIPIIQDEIRLDNKKGNYKEVYEESGINLKECLKLDSNIFNLLIYSIIWRFSITHRIEDNISILPEEIEENLRVILNDSLSLDIGDISKKDVPVLDFQVFTADSFEENMSGLAYTENIHKEPTFFFANEFIILFYENGYKNSGGYLLPINQMVQAKNVLNEAKQNPKIGFVSTEYFKELLNRILRDGAKAILNKLAKDVSNCTGLSLSESRFQLGKLGIEIHQKTGKDIMICFEEAAHLICNT